MTKINKEGWEIKKLSDVCDKASSNIVISKLEESEGDFPLFGASGLVKYIDFYHRDTPYIGIVKDGAGVGRVDIYPAFSSLVGTMQYILPKDECLIEYIKYFLIKLNLAKHVSGATIPHIYFKDYGKELIPVPSKDIQQRIVEELDEINAIISAKKQQLSKLDELAQSIFYNMFGDPVANEKGWEVIELGSVCEVSSAKRVLIEDVVDEGIPFLRGTELSELCRATQNEKVEFKLFITEEHYEKVKAITGVPKYGDLLIPSINADGLVWIVNTEAPFYFKDGRVLWVHVNAEFYHSIMLQRLLNVILKETYSTMANGATFAELKLFVLRELKVPLPPLSLQEAFAARVAAIEEEKAAIAASIEKIQTLLDARMQEYFG